MTACPVISWTAFADLPSVLVGNLLQFVLCDTDMAAAVPDGMYSSDVVWSCDCPHCAQSADKQVYHNMSFTTASSNLPDYHHAAHAMIYATDDRVLFDNYSMTAAIMVRHNL